MSGTVFIVGATSAIGAAVAARLARRGRPLLLAARDADELERVAADLRVRFGAAVVTRHFDALDFEGHEAFVASCVAACGGAWAGAILCHGHMVDQAVAEREAAAAVATIGSNLTGSVTLLGALARQLQERPGSFLCAISSVAGDRGRQSNFIYGASKAGLNVYLQGLRNRLTPHRVAVITVKPGFVATPMTYGLVGGPLTASAERVAAAICRAIARRRSVVYVPWFWRFIMLAVRAIPEWIFRRLKM
jgi:short-subunit dehydrogenase